MDTQVVENSRIFRALIQIWSEVLEVDSPEPNSSFLDLGGDSLAAMLCISRLRNSFGVEFTLDDFFLTDSTLVEFTSKVELANGTSPSI
jgi:acyl carrier protein